MVEIGGWGLQKAGKYIVCQQMDGRALLTMVTMTMVMMVMMATVMTIVMMVMATVMMTMTMTGDFRGFSKAFRFFSLLYSVDNCMSYISRITVTQVEDRRKK